MVFERHLRQEAKRSGRRAPTGPIEPICLMMFNVLFLVFHVLNLRESVMGSNFEKPGFDLRCQDMKKVMKTKRVTSHQRQKLRKTV